MNEAARFMMNDDPSENDEGNFATVAHITDTGGAASHSEAKSATVEISALKLYQIFVPAAVNNILVQTNIRERENVPRWQERRFRPPATQSTRPQRRLPLVDRCVTSTCGVGDALLPSARPTILGRRITSRFLHEGRRH